jgi:RNA recognition motif-containing protein
MKLLIIDGLPREVSEQHLRNLFAPFGEIRSVQIVRDPYGHSLSFGFVEMTTDEAADRARKQLDRTELNGEVIRVCVSLHADEGWVKPSP